MFFFIGGIQPKTVCLERQARSCPVCDHGEVWLKRVDHYLSLFFIPLFRVKKGTPFFTCENCNTVFDERSTPKSERAGYKTTTCPSCGRTLEEDFDYCPRCGRKIRSL